MRITKLLLTSLLLLWVPYIFSISTSVGGLYFYSHKEIKDKRTGLVLGTASAPLVLPHGFNLEFNLNVRNEESIFGYVCRVVANDSTSIDILSSQYNEKDVFWFVCGNDKKEMLPLQDVPHFKKGEWVHVRMSYFPKLKEFMLSINGVTRKLILSENAPLYNKFEIFFGANEHPRFYTTDDAPIILRDVTIKNLSNKILYYWALREHGTNNVYDEITHLRAGVSNPLWEIDSHVHWEISDSLTVADKPLIAFNDQKSDLYIVGPTTMNVYHISKGTRETLTYKSGKPYHTQANQLVYNKYSNELWSYDFEGKSISRYNFSTNTWSMNAGDTQETNHWHHDALISPKDSSLVCFGGYGHFTYHSDLLILKPGLPAWKKVTLFQKIEPRYLAAAGLNGNEMLLFGGFGNKTGEQQLSPHSFYDLYSISLSDFKVTKKWSMDMLEGMVQARSLVMDNNGKDLYTLGYSGKKFNTWIHLYKLNIDKAGMIQLGDSIPYKFSDTESFCDLYYVPDIHHFLTVTVNRTQNKYSIHLFRLDYPAFPLNEIIQSGTGNNSFFSKNTLLILGFVLLVGFNVFLATLWFKRRRKHQRSPELLSEIKKETSLQQGENYLHQPQFSKLEIKKQVIPSSISLIGGFQAINRDGKDITASFTTTVKNLLLLILLYSYKNNKGISYMGLDEILWFDKSETSARNNRNVNINKLRALLEEFDGFDVNNDNSYWCTKMEPPFVCDYVVLMNFANRTKEKNVNFSIDDLTMVLSMASKGLLLPNVQTEWVDSFKAEYSTLIIDALLTLAKQAHDSQNHKLLIQIADTILVQDQIDEDALVYKCKSLTALGKKSAALSFYNNFCRNYKTIMDDDFPSSFNQIMNA